MTQARRLLRLTLLAPAVVANLLANPDAAVTAGATIVAGCFRSRWLLIQSANARFTPTIDPHDFLKTQNFKSHYLKLIAAYAH